MAEDGDAGSGTPAGLVAMHVGFAVGDLDQAVELFAATGVGPWARSDWKTSRYWDASRGRIVEAVSRVAFGRISSGLALELIQPDGSAGEVPAVWEVGPQGGPPHVGYWCSDLDAAALTLLEGGARVALARATEGLSIRRQQVADGTAELPSPLDTSFFSGPLGPMIELVPEGIWATRLPALLGDEITGILPAPPGQG